MGLSHGMPLAVLPRGSRAYSCSHTQIQGKKKKEDKSLVPQKTAALERLAGDAGEDKKLLDIGLTEKMAALPEQAAK